MSRREFLSIPKIQYDLVPSIENNICRSNTHQCRLCGKRCNNGAIIINKEGQASIEKDKCTGCGICIDICPARAILYPYFTHAEIIREIEVLLEKDKGINLEARAILFTCEHSKSLLNDYLLNGGTLPHGVLPVVVPSLGRLNSFFLLYPFSLGAIGIGLIPCSKKDCYCGVKLEDVEKEISLTDAILKSFNEDGYRLTLMHADSPAEIEKEIKEFGEGARRRVKNVIARGHSLTDLLINISEVTGKGFLLEGYNAIPKGIVWLKDKSSCTFCGVCEKHCPANALRLEAVDGCKELTFSYNDCIACSECVLRCPERNLRMKKLLDTERLKKAETISLAREDAILCRNCATPFINQALLRRIKEKSGLSGSGMDFITLCPDCRVKTVFSSLKEIGSKK